LVIPTTYTYLATKQHRVAPSLEESGEAWATWAA
jgi:hypothetical protein